MNRNFKKIACFMATALLLTACAQDEMTNGDTLPEGKYPLQIASVSVVGESTSEPWGAKGVQSRVAESTDGGSSLWEDGDLIGVGIEGTGYTSSDNKKYEMTVSGENVTVAPPKDGTPVYWKNTAPAAVNAWYPLKETVSLSDQKDKLKYVLKSSTKGTYESDVELNFKHSLAKVRVVLTGDQAKKIESVMLNTYKQCTHKQGSIDQINATVTDDDWVTMKSCDYTTGNVGKCWEANVVPTESMNNGYKILKFRVKIKDTETVIGGTLNDGITPLAGKVNTITLTVTEAGPKPITDGESISEPGEYTMNGSYSQPITLSGNNITLTLDGATSTAVPAIKVVSGHPTILVKGENTFNQTASNTNLSAIALDGQGSGILTIKQSTEYPGGNAVIGSAENGTAGNILIKNMILHIDLTGRETLSGAVIGCGFGYQGYASCGDITISHTDLNVNGGSCDIGGAVIDTGMLLRTEKVECGNITITLSSGETREDFLNKLYVTYAENKDYTLPEKVGKGRVFSNSGTINTGTITWK